VRERILCIGDVHAPFVSKPTVSKILDIAEELKPTIIIQLGDAYDFYSFSHFPRSVNLMTPSQEITDGRCVMEEIWGALHRRAKKAKKYQLKGNHDDRITKRLREKFPELESLVDLSQLWKFDNVTTIQDSREELEIEDIVFTHGYRSKLGDHMRYNHRNTVVGHSHRGGVALQPINGKVLFELNAGYIADPFHESLVYRSQLKYFNWTHGVGFIDHLGPRFIPL